MSMQKWFLGSLLVMFFIFGYSNAYAITIHVPEEYPTIQQGINAAQNGDTVLVADGVYTGPNNKNLDYAGKVITVISENGPHATIIDCENSGRGFNFHNGEGLNSHLEGFTIKNGYITGGDGGGILCNNSSSPTITNCIIFGNIAYNGGGISCFSSGPTITNCIIFNNTANSYAGGGIYCFNASPTITNCTILNNNAGAGGGIYCISFDNSTITNCTISNNVGTSYGGGISCRFNSHPTITNCTISENTAGIYGGGIECTGDSYPSIANCTITMNTATSNGGGMVVSNSTMTIANCILWDDSPQEIYIYSGNTAIVTYSDIQGGWQGIGNIESDPLFVDAQVGHYSLEATSPCIDAGDPAILDPDNTVSNMGAYGGPEAKIANITVFTSQTQVQPGQSLEYTALLSNNFSNSQRLFITPIVIFPDGRIHTDEVIDITLLPYETLERQRSFTIPANAPLGNYIFKAQVGAHETGIIDESIFNFTVIEPGLPNYPVYNSIPDKPDLIAVWE